MINRLRHIAIAVLTVVCVFLCACTHTSSSEIQDVAIIQIWTYYNGMQLSSFQELVDEFNVSRGADLSVYVETANLGSVEDLRDAILNSAEGKLGAEELPNIFSCYADTAFELNEKGLLVDIGPYLNKREREEYIEGYLEEGALSSDNELKIFPVGKSTEVMLINKNDIQPFLEANNLTYDDLSTIEGVTHAAQLYYEWTDAKTEEPNDGKALCGRDALANYFFIGAKQLGLDIISYQNGTLTFQFDKDVIRKLWDNFYVPFVKGYFCAEGRYRSDDIKTGQLMSLIGSSASATFFPMSVIDESGDEHFIEMDVLPSPQFKDGQDYIVQQGAGMSIINTSEREVKASIEFLKWFTAKGQSLKFLVTSGYLPVTKQANNIEEVRKLDTEISKKVESTFEVAMDEVNTSKLYTPPAFTHGAQFRDVLEVCMSDEAASDAKQVRERLEQGMSYEEACAPYLSDERFDRWYDEVYHQLQSIVDKSA